MATISDISARRTRHGDHLLYLRPDVPAMDWTKTPWKALELHGDSELLKSIGSTIQNNCRRDSHLDFFKRHLPIPTSDYPKTWRYRGNIEIQNC